MAIPLGDVKFSGSFFVTDTRLEYGRKKSKASQRSSSMKTRETGVSKEYRMECNENALSRLKAIIFKLSFLDGNLLSSPDSLQSSTNIVCRKALRNLLILNYLGFASGCNERTRFKTKLRDIAITKHLELKVSKNNSQTNCL